jgi:hypothetical protein
VTYSNVLFWYSGERFEVNDETTQSRVSTTGMAEDPNVKNKFIMLIEFRKDWNKDFGPSP